MSKLQDYKLLSFDVYGTLVDWETGILNALKPLLANMQTKASKKEILTIFQDLESTQQKLHPEMKYSDLLASIYPMISARLDIPGPAADEDEATAHALAASIPKWPAFPDTVDALKRLSKHYKLVVLSNVDRDSFQGTLEVALEGFPFDAVLTAQDIGSYKPDPANFRYMLSEAERLGIEKNQVLQTAQSQFHDHIPARAMGIKSVWIERKDGVMGNVTDPVYDWRFDTLEEMADAFDAELASGL